MKKSVAITLGLCMAASLVATKPCSAAFTVGGENGWQLTTDGIVDVFATYDMTSPLRNGNNPTSRGHGWIDGNTTGKEYSQRFGIGVGLLPSVVAFNIKAPTTNGVDSTVRIGLYPSIQNDASADGSANRFSTGTHLDVREVFYTAKGKYGEILAGRALNLYQAKNILTDMTLLTAGTVSTRDNTVTLGHIGFGYLYPSFGPQMRYTTPDFSGFKAAISVNEPYDTSQYATKTNSPRVETEFSYAKTFGGGTSVQAWLSGLYQNAVVANDLTANGATIKAGTNNMSLGGAYGLSAGYKGLNLLGSGYGGKGLGMVSAQDGGLLSSLGTNPAEGAADPTGKERQYWGFLLQATYKINSTWMVGANYGQSRQEETAYDSIQRSTGAYALTKKQESAVGTVTYNLNSFTQFVVEYIYAQQTWHDGASQHSNQFALGTMFYW
jgi:hypothetical protein